MVIRVGSRKKIPRVTCLNCASAFDSVVTVEGEAQPREGAFIVCSKCGHFMGFGEALQLRSLNNTDIQLLAKTLARRVK